MASVKLAGLISAMTIAACGVSVAEQGTDAQREACTPDAFRLCMSAMPDSGRVESCLRAAGPQLSPACYAVFYPPQTEQMIAQGRERRSPRDMQQREVQRRERGYGDRYEQPRDDQRDGLPRDYQSRGRRDERGPASTFDDD